tara:strand:- start:221 stop:1441 length:1221 start_codon:yes stop_codon:yes gene_type:complete
MEDELKNIQFLNELTTFSDLEKMINLPPMSPFSEDIIDYLNILSKEINKYPKIREYPDVATFAFFCRRANIIALKAKKNYNKNETRLGRGIIYHVAPSNVPVNFAYSLVTGLLSGNSNIVKVPSKVFNQIDIISSAINRIARNSKYLNIAKRIILVRYDRNSDATKFFSSICDVRIIWGGDETIQQIRRYQLQPRSFDLTFADRFSICVINANKYINESDPKKISKGFFNDTYLFDQNACTSPHLIIWIGSKTNLKNAKKKFWDCLYGLLKNNYKVQSISVINKLTAFCNQAIQMHGLKLVQKKDNLIWRITLDKLEKDLDKFRCDSGYFLEYETSSLIEISKIINRKYQTLSYYGFSKNEMRNLINSLNPVGIDRMVPIGRTMEFSLTWDGYNLINSLTRKIEIL